MRIKIAVCGTANFVSADDSLIFDNRVEDIKCVQVMYITRYQRTLKFLYAINQ